jgi:hypothetical protein
MSKVPGIGGRSFEEWLHAADTKTWVREMACEHRTASVMRLAYEAGLTAGCSAAKDALSTANSILDRRA